MKEQKISENKPMVIANILINHEDYQEFLKFREIKKLEEERAAQIFLEEQKKYEICCKTIDYLEMSVRLYNCLKYNRDWIDGRRIDAPLFYIGDVVSRSDSQILAIPNLGIESLKELKAELKTLDLTLSMKLPEHVIHLLKKQKELDLQKSEKNKVVK